MPTQENYRLVKHIVSHERTTWWKDENSKVESEIWYIEGPGVSRPANHIEIDLWNQKLAAENQSTISLKESA